MTGVLRTVVNDPSDARLDGFRGLRDPELRRSREHRDGVFVAEGVAVVGRLARSPYRTLVVAVTVEQEASVVAELDGVGGLDDVALLVVDRGALDEVAGFPVHRGVLALGAREPVRGVEGLADLGPGLRTVVVLEECNDHENMGAIARSARALGADAMLLSPRCADPLYRRSVRVSMGEILRLPVLVADEWPGSLARLRSMGFTVVALTPAPDAVALDAVAVARDERVAVLLGAEGPGLTTGAQSAADVRVRIPITTGVDSLNVGHAAAVALHHVAASRRHAA
jgi:tRNA G18 (ribose-2'-O)-methylase SpoU